MSHTVHTSCAVWFTQLSHFLSLFMSSHTLFACMSCHHAHHIFHTWILPLCILCTVRVCVFDLMCTFVWDEHRIWHSTQLTRLNFQTLYACSKLNLWCLRLLILPQHTILTINKFFCVCVFHTIKIRTCLLDITFDNNKWQPVLETCIFFSDMQHCILFYCSSCRWNDNQIFVFLTYNIYVCTVERLKMNGVFKIKLRNREYTPDRHLAHIDVKKFLNF